MVRLLSFYNVLCINNTVEKIFGFDTDTRRIGATAHYHIFGIDSIYIK